MIELNLGHYDTYKKMKAEFDRAVLEDRLIRCAGNQTEMARSLQLNRGTIRKRMKQLNIGMNNEKHQHQHPGNPPRQTDQIRYQEQQNPKAAHARDPFKPF